jgi:hypothetical protein
MDEKELEKLYNAVSSKYDVGDFNSFKAKMATSDLRKRFYDVVGQKGLDLGDYNVYEHRLSGAKKQSLGGMFGKLITESKDQPPLTQPINIDEGDDPIGDIVSKAQFEKDNLVARNNSADATHVNNVMISPKDKFIKGHDEVNAFNATINHAQNYFNDKPQEAIAYVEKNAAKPSNNVTLKKAQERVGVLKKVNEAIDTSPNLDEAALKYFGDENAPEAKKGAYVSAFLNHPDVIDRASHDHNAYEKYLTSQFNLNSNYPSYAFKTISSKIAQERENKGMNSVWANNPSIETTDSLVEQMVKDGKLNEHDALFYKHNINPVLDFMHKMGAGSDIIKTTGGLESFGEGVTQGVSGIANSLRDIGNKVTFGKLKDAGLLENDVDRAKRLQQEQYATATVNPTHNFISHNLGHFTGYMTPMILGSLAGVPGYVNMTLQFEGDRADAARQMFPNDKKKQFAYTALSTAADVFLADFLPTQKAGSAIRGTLEKDIVSNIGDLASGKIAPEVFKETLLNKFANVAAGAGKFGLNVAKENTKAGGVMAGLSVVHNALDAITGGRDVKFDDAANEAVQSFKTGFVGSTFISALAAGKLENRKLAGSSIVEMASNPEHFKNVIEEQARLNPSLNKEDLIQNLNDAAQIYSELKDTDLKPAQKEKFIVNALAEKIHERKAESSTNTVIKSDAQSKAKEAASIQKDIIKGEDLAHEHDTFDELKSNALAELQLATKDKKIKGLWADMAEANPDRFLDVIAEQALNKAEGGKDHEIGFAEESMKKAKEQFGEPLVNAAIEYYNSKQAPIEEAPHESKVSVIKPEENTHPNVIELQKNESPIPAEANDTRSGIDQAISSQNIPVRDDFSTFKEHLLDQIVNVKSGNYDWQITEIPLQQKYRERGVRDIRAGKNSKAAQAVEESIKQMFDDGYVYLRRGPGGSSESVQIPIKEYMAEVNKPFTIDDVEHLNTLLGEEGFDKALNEAIDYGKQSTAGEGENSITSTGATTDSTETIGDNQSAPHPDESTIGNNGSGAEPPTTEPAAIIHAERPATELSHRGLQDVANEFSLDDVHSRERKSDIQLKQDALNKIHDWADAGKYAENVEALVKDAEKNKVLTDEEQAIIEIHLANVTAEARAARGTDLYDKKLQEVKRVKDAGEKTRSAAGAALRIRSNSGSRPMTIEDAMVEEMEAAGVDVLTPEQKATVEKEFNDLTEKEKAYNDKIAALEAENAKLKADKEFKKVKSSTKKEKKTHEDFVKERKDIVSKAREDLLKLAKGEKGAMSSVPGLAQLVVLAPHVKDAMVSLAKEGIQNLSEVVDKLHEEFKDVLEGLSKKDIHNIIAGEYNEKKYTRNELAATMRDLRDEAALVNKLELILKGEEPKTEKKKVERNKQITDLRNKIKSIAKAKVDAEREVENAKKLAAKEEEQFIRDFEKEKDTEAKLAAKAKMNEAKRVAKELARKTSEEIALQSIKTRTASEIKKVEAQLKSGDFAPPEKKAPIELDAEAKALKAQLIQLRQEREIRLIKLKYESRSRYEKARDLTLEVLNVPRTIMSSMDFSAPLRQGIVASVTHPVMASKAGIEMFRQAFSQKRFDEWFFDLKESKRYDTIKKSELSVTDPHDYRLSAKEEAFMNNLAEKIPIVGKFIKGSERAYVGFLNKMRVDLFNRGVDALEADGKTFENSPDVYKGLASYINNQTGRGGLGKLENYAPVLNTVFFSPRLIASRLNLLNPIYYAKLPKEVRREAAIDMLKFVGFGLSILTLAKLNGAQVEDDPRSTDFGKIKSGDTRWDIWGGFQQYARLAAQMISGQKKSTMSEDIQNLNGEGRFGETRSDVLQRFSRGKLAPVPSMAVDFLSGRTAVGDKVTVASEAESHLLPLIYSDMKQAMQDQGIKSLLTVGVPATFGVGVNTYTKRQSTSTRKPSKPSKQNKKEKK